MANGLSYRKTGVDIDAADAAKRGMADSVNSGSPRVLNRLGAFASLVEGTFEGYDHPVLVYKTDEPGSKQLLAGQYGSLSSVCYDLVNHLINDVIVMGAEPLYMQDCIVCGKLEPDTIKRLVAAMAAACQEQGCVLVGGETSEQPGVVGAGTYVLSASAIGVVERERIIDGQRITSGDVVLALGSNGLHTNGYTLVRALIDKSSGILDEAVDGERFLDVILRPQTCYWQAVRGVLGEDGLHGLAHITGGGIEGNLNRILPRHLQASVDRSAIRIPEVFRLIRERGKVADADMLRTFNMGVGLTVVCAEEAVAGMVAQLRERDIVSYPIGQIDEGSGDVVYSGELDW